MSERLNVLISAYACEPNKGSEPEVGWQWSLQMARFHEVTVLTRANNRPAIEQALAALRGRQPLPRFVYHDRNAFFLDLKRRARAVKLYYLLWQKSAHEVIARLHDVHHYDLMHHVTFAGFRYPVAIWGHGVPCIWGPIGGIESIPRGLLPWQHLGSLVQEVGRNANNLLQATPFHVLPKRARATTLILVSTPEMQRTFARLHFQAQLMPTIGLSVDELPYRPHPPSGEGPLKLLFVGNIITLKGVDLALAALKASQTNATLTFVGTGNFLEAAQRQVATLGLAGQVTFLGRLPRAEVLKLYPDYDVFLFPSLHDTGGYAVIEAMFNELPVICLDCGGPAVAVREECGIKVPLGKRLRVIAGLADAIGWYDRNRAAAGAQGQRARAVVLEHYDWRMKGERMAECYQQALTLAQASRPRNRYAGMGSVTNLLHTMFTLRGLIAAALGVFLIGALGFVSIGHLKHQAFDIVSDTLPGLTYAGQANANLAQAFDHTLMFLMTEDPVQQARLHKEIDAFSQETTSCLTAYKAALFEPEDHLLFNTILKRRAEYLKLREEIVRLVEAHQHAEALRLCQSELLPAYLRYKDAGEKLFEFNIRQGQQRGQHIMSVCSTTQWVVAGIGILVFAMGFLIGLLK